MAESAFKGFEKVDYRKLNGRQQEVYNFHQIAALLVKYGYATYTIRDDWKGGDMFARHMLTGEPMTIQIKSRLTFDQKYLGKALWIAFPEADTQAAYLYPHDAVLNEYLDLRSHGWTRFLHRAAFLAGCVRPPAQARQRAWGENRG